MHIVRIVPGKAFPSLLKLGLEYPSELMDQFRKRPESFDSDLASLQTDRFIKAVLESLKKRGPREPKWLVVIDNADDLSWVRPLIPQGERGTVIFTSRNKLVGNLASEAIHVDRMSEKEAVDLLFRSAAVDASDQGETQFQNAVSIVNKLECFPLAVDLAGYYFPRLR
jgi:hypothetical protein